MGWCGSYVGVVRPRKADRDAVLNKLVSFKVSPNEHALLVRLVEARADEIEAQVGQRMTLTVGAYLRWLMAEDAKRRGVSLDADPWPASAAVREGPKSPAKPRKVAKAGPGRR